MSRFLKNVSQFFYISLYASKLIFIKQVSTKGVSNNVFLLYNKMLLYFLLEIYSQILVSKKHFLKYGTMESKGNTNIQKRKKREMTDVIIK